MLRIFILISIISYLFLWGMANRYTKIAKKYNINIAFGLFRYFTLTVCCFIPIINVILAIICIINIFAEEESIVEAINDEELED